MIATADYELVTEEAGLVDRSDRTKLLLSGAEAVDFLQGQVTNDVEALAPGSGCYAAILNHKGKLRTDLRVLRGEDWVWVDCDPVGAAVVLHTVRTYSLGRDVSFEDLTGERAMLALVGPGASAAARPRAARGGARLRGRRARASTCAPPSGWT